MSFEPILRRILDGCEGTLGVALMGNDGIPIEQVMAEGAEAHGPEDVGAAGVEFGRILDEIRKASATLGGGALQETHVALARFAIVLRVVDEDSFLVQVLGPQANSGKARYLARRHLTELRNLL